MLGGAWNTLNMVFSITQNFFISPHIRQHTGWCQYIRYPPLLSANRYRSGNGGFEYDNGLLSLASLPPYFMNIKGDLCWCQRFKTWNWPVRSGVSLSPFLCPEIDFADLALSLWNALGMCVCMCVCLCLVGIYGFSVLVLGCCSAPNNTVASGVKAVSVDPLII